jgi:hypothetical protein
VPFAIRALWREPKNYVDNCQFCCVIVIGLSAKNKHKIVCSNEDNPHDDKLPVPEPPENGLAFTLMMTLYQFQSLQKMDWHF